MPPVESSGEYADESPSGFIAGEQINATLPEVCIIGNQGKMGGMLERRLRSAGYPVCGVDRIEVNGKSALSHESLAEKLVHARIVILCVPVTALEQVLQAVVPHLSADQVLMDITSVKVLPMRWMEALFSGRVVGAHPLFGPNPAPEDQRVVLVRGSRADDAACSDAEQLFVRVGCEIHWATAQEHDAGVGFSQSLNFAVSAAFFSALSRHDGIRPFLTPSFKRHLEAARKHLTIDTGMFLEFTSMNPEFPSAVQQYRSILQEISEGHLPEVASEAACWYAES